jgi:hypothetical protein
VVWQRGSDCATCLDADWVSSDGSSLIAAVVKPDDHASAAQGIRYDDSLLRISVATDQATGILFQTTILSHEFGGVPGMSASADSSGTYWIVKEDNNLGWVSDGLFHRLQSLGTVVTAAW